MALPYDPADMMSEEKINKARELYEHGGVSHKDVAEAVGVSRSTITRWKANGWAFKGLKRGGAPKGNKNGARPHPTERGNTHALSSGEYSRLQLTTLTEEELGLYEAMLTSPQDLMDHNIKILTLRLRRMLTLREQATQDRELLTEKINKTVINDGSETPSVIEHVQKRAAVIDKIMHIEDAITRVQDKLMRAAENKHKWELEQAALEQERAGW